MGFAFRLIVVVAARRSVLLSEFVWSSVISWNVVNFWLWFFGVVYKTKVFYEKMIEMSDSGEVKC